MPAIRGVKHEYVVANGLTMHVATAGPETGEPLLLLHGWPQNWYAYRHLIPVLAQNGYSVFAPDLRGWGSTDAPPAGYSVAQRTQDVIALIEALGLAKVKLIGHDWGCFVGFLLCAERPGLVDSYVGAGLFHLWPKTGVKQAVALRRLWYWPIVAAPVLGPKAVSNPRFRRFIYKLWAAENAQWTDEEFEHLTGHLNEPARARATMLSYRAAIKDFAPYVAGRYRHTTLQTPILLLLGGKDGCVEPTLVQPTRHAPNLKIEVLPNIGHFLLEEAPDVVLQRSLNHFKWPASS
jgi:pimeloyl-ACP methyl ester carboxylesterase